MDEQQIHIAPVLLGDSGLFDALGPGSVQLEGIRAIHSPAVSHLECHVVK